MIDFFKWVNVMAICASPQVLNTSEEQWNQRDTKELNAAVEHGTCKRLYPFTSPCIATFIKVGVRTYKVWCGAMRGD